jgi:acid stress-induced BolA-like protein IbaG/YrbA
MTADELKDIISADLACEHIALEGDGRHWYATIVSAEFEGLRSSDISASIARWVRKCTPTRCTRCR